MKHFINLILLTVCLVFYFNINVYAQDKKNLDDPTKWEYFTIFVKASEDTLFTQLNSELGFGLNRRDEFDIERIRGAQQEYVFGGAYQIVVDLRDPNTSFFVVGNYDSKDAEVDRRSSRFLWQQLPKMIQDGLINWTGNNKYYKLGKKKITEIENDPKTWKYFKILARIDDDSLFFKVQEDMSLKPKLESYTLVVNITDTKPENQYVVLGDELDPSAQRFAWKQFSKSVRKGLINWTGTNKEDLSMKIKWNLNADLYSEVIKLNPNYGKLYYLYYLKGIFNRRSGNYETAIEDLNKSIELKPDFAKSYFARAYTFGEKNFELALQDYETVLKLDPDYTDVFWARGQLLYDIKKYKEAISDLEKAIELGTWSKDYYNYLIEQAKKSLK